MTIERHKFLNNMADVIGNEINSLNEEVNQSNSPIKYVLLSYLVSLHHYTCMVLDGAYEECDKFTTEIDWFKSNYNFYTKYLKSKNSSDI